jgi:ribonuclease HI
MTKQFIIYADGACSGNPGPGGWAFEIQTPDGRVFTGSGGSAATTNNIMELTAAAEALEKLAEEQFFLLADDVLMRLDSQYVLDGLFQWLLGWKAKGWKTASKKPVKNRELWERIDAAYTKLLSTGFALKPDWVKGHDGEPGNERVDTAAQEQRDAFAVAPMTAMVTNAATSMGIPVTDVPLSTPPQPSDLVGIPAVQAAAAPAEIHPGQVDLMRTILDLHASGDYSIKKVIEQVRANAVALGCR